MTNAHTSSGNCCGRVRSKITEIFTAIKDCFNRCLQKIKNLLCGAKATSQTNNDSSSGRRVNNNPPTRRRVNNDHLTGSTLPRLPQEQVRRIDENGKTLLHLACETNVYDCRPDCPELYNDENEHLLNERFNDELVILINRLIASGVDVNARNHNGDAALDLIVRNPRLYSADHMQHILQALIDAGADVRTPLQIAAQERDLETVRILLTAPNINIEATDANGQTALHYAHRRRDHRPDREAVIQALIQAGAREDAISHDGRRPDQMPADLPDTSAIMGVIVPRPHSAELGDTFRRLIREQVGLPV